MTQTILHSSRSDEWYTPAWLIYAIKTVLGDIDFDPASCEYANRCVDAASYLTAKDNGLETEWPMMPSTVFCNPPSGGRERLAKKFWEKLIQYRESGSLDHAIFIAFSVEQLQTSQSCPVPMTKFPLCIPKKRVKFVSPGGDFNNPTHSQAVIYVPGITNNTSKFVDMFECIGSVLYPYP